MNEIEKEEETGEISNELDDELQDLFDHAHLIIPVYVRNGC